ncbi:NUDIX hydrolase [Catellatospora tritici]|uniref:NUDIX hydrolase n=1 Tax=Catellatospora tritici TaxID=2851566 RepID=UPI001C2CEB4A|nr:CoA pyrophosphatase [Catellatospora tritici]MBV1853418.1 CoA pyrophosphatase [Catellatospora tritici]
MSRTPPQWLEPLLTNLGKASAVDFTRIPTPEDGGRPAAVLILLADEHEPGAGPDVLIMQRAATLRTHAGQPAFPGGAVEPQDTDASATALREAQEEVGLDPDSVTVLAELPTLWIPVTDFLVTPVLAWWHAPHPVGAHQPEEVAHVARLPLAELADPVHRVRVRHRSGWIGPAFHARGMLVWGFTAGVLSTLLDLGGWARPWDTSRVESLPEVVVPPHVTPVSGNPDPPSVG